MAQFFAVFLQLIPISLTIIKKCMLDRLWNPIFDACFIYVGCNMTTIFKGYLLIIGLVSMVLGLACMFMPSFTGILLLKILKEELLQQALYGQWLVFLLPPVMF